MDGCVLHFSRLGKNYPKWGWESLAIQRVNNQCSSFTWGEDRKAEGLRYRNRTAFTQPSKSYHRSSSVLFMSATTAHCKDEETHENGVRCMGNWSWRELHSASPRPGSMSRCPNNCAMTLCIRQYHQCFTHTTASSGLIRGQIIVLLRPRCWWQN